MAIKPDVNYVGKITPGGASYPYGSARNVTVPGDGTGTPLEQAWVNDMWGLLQKLLDAAGVVPSGAADTILASDYWDSLEKLFNRFITHADTGAADAYVLASVSGADIDAYRDGHEIVFKAVNANTGASTVNIAAIGVQALTLPGGTALPANTIVAGQYVRAVYDLANTRYEFTGGAASIPFDDTNMHFTAAEVQSALEATDISLAKAWVKFDGTGVVSINSTYNVSSITDNGVGDYTVNFTNNMPNADYSALATQGAITNTGIAFTTNHAVGSYDLTTVNNGAPADNADISSVVFSS